MHGLQSLEALLDGGLTFVRLQDLLCGQGSIIADEGVLPRVRDHAELGKATVPSARL